MDITPAIAEGKQIIETYGEKRFKVSGKRYQGSILVFPDRVCPWPVVDHKDLTVVDFGPAMAEMPDVLLLGCGEKMVLLPKALRQDLRATGLVVEVMDTGAACRTYNVLMAEERQVVAALIAVV